MLLILFKNNSSLIEVCGQNGDDINEAAFVNAYGWGRDKIL